MTKVRSIVTRRLSTFRTEHQFAHYGEIYDIDDFRFFRKWAMERNLPLLILGNGSNILFKRFKIETLVLRNRIEARMEVLDSGTIYATSSLSIMPILKYCERNSLDSFYFLASVPATVGGAIAMNAGGAQETIFDFLDTVTYLDGENICTRAATEIYHSHRQTLFSGITDKLILSATFRFPARVLDQSEIRNRIEWCHKNQDLSAPNCGSVFRECDRVIMKRVRWLVPCGIRIPYFLTQYSRKVNNWIICRNKRSWPIVVLIRLVQFIHWILGKKAIPEIVEVD